MNNTPLEIEYKFLIEMPDLKLLSTQADYRKKKLCQMYLELPSGFSEHGSRCRIRKVEENGKVIYYKTFKKALTEMTRIEIEDKISECEYLKLSEFIKKGTSAVEKVRHTFSFEGYTCEIDVFSFWEDKAFLEIEVESEDVLPPVPSFIRIIKDVSKDKNYRNSVIAKRIFEGTAI